MSIEIEDFSTDPIISSLIQWAKGTALWDGRQVALEEAPHLKQEIEKKILSILSESNLSSPAWHNTLANLALLGATDASYSLTEKSRPFEIAGIKYENQGIGFINGIGTNLEGARSNATHLQKLTPNQHIEGVYNQTHGMAADLAEVLTLNLHGVCINTGEALSANWEKFHEEHKNNPKAKYLQFCHSGGTLAVKNQLAQLPKEVQQRIMIVAIAPAAIITDETCYKAFNYASKRDVVPFTESLVNGFLDPHELKVSEKTKKAVANQKYLILLDSDPDASFLDHEFTSPTFSEVIKKHIDDYNLRNGEYE